MMTYMKYESKCNLNNNRRCIDGKITGSNKCVGYCTYIEHEGFLTDELRCKHDCMNKECNYYIPKPKKKSTKKSNIAQDESKMLGIVQNETESYEGMKVIHAKKESNNKWIFEYVTIVRDYPYEMITQNIRKLLGANVVLRKLDYDFDVCTKILLA